MKEPAMAADGHTYERAAIMQWCVLPPTWLSCSTWRTLHSLLAESAGDEAACAASVPLLRAPALPAALPRPKLHQP